MVGHRLAPEQHDVNEVEAGGDDTIDDGMFKNAAAPRPGRRNAVSEHEVRDAASSKAVGRCLRCPGDRVGPCQASAYVLRGQWRTYRPGATGGGLGCLGCDNGQKQANIIPTSKQAEQQRV